MPANTLEKKISIDSFFQNLDEISGELDRVDKKTDQALQEVKSSSIKAFSNENYFESLLKSLTEQEEIVQKVSSENQQQNTTINNLTNVVNQEGDTVKQTIVNQNQITNQISEVGDRVKSLEKSGEKVVNQNQITNQISEVGDRVKSLEKSGEKVVDQILNLKKENNTENQQLSKAFQVLKQSYDSLSSGVQSVRTDVEGISEYLLKDQQQRRNLLEQRKLKKARETDVKEKSDIMSALKKALGGTKDQEMFGNIMSQQDYAAIKNPPGGRASGGGGGLGGGALAAAGVGVAAGALGTMMGGDSASPGSSGSGGGGGFSGSGVAKGTQVAKRLQKDLGLKDYQAAAVVGNLMQENTNLVPDLLEGSKKGLLSEAMRKKIGYGWAQWTYSSRQQELFNLAKSMGVDPTKQPLTDEINYAMLVRELPRYDSGGRFRNSKNIEEASNWILFQYENPADKGSREQQERIGDAKKVLQGIKSSSQQSSTAAKPAGTPQAPPGTPQAGTPQAPPGTPQAGAPQAAAGTPQAGAPQAAAGTPQAGAPQAASGAAPSYLPDPSKSLGANLRDLTSSAGTPGTAQQSMMPPASGVDQKVSQTASQISSAQPQMKQMDPSSIVPFDTQQVASGGYSQAPRNQGQQSNITSTPDFPEAIPTSNPLTKMWTLSAINHLNINGSMDHIYG